MSMPALTNSRAGQLKACVLVENQLLRSSTAVCGARPRCALAFGSGNLTLVSRMLNSIITRGTHELKY